MHLTRIAASVVAALATATALAGTTAGNAQANGLCYANHRTDGESAIQLEELGENWCGINLRVTGIRATYLDHDRNGHFEYRGPQGHIGRGRTQVWRSGMQDTMGVNSTANGLYCIIFWEEDGPGHPQFQARNPNCVHN